MVEPFLIFKITNSNHEIKHKTKYLTPNAPRFAPRSFQKKSAIGNDILEMVVDDVSIFLALACERVPVDFLHGFVGRVAASVHDVLVRYPEYVRYRHVVVAQVVKACLKSMVR